MGSVIEIHFQCLFIPAKPTQKYKQFSLLFQLILLPVPSVQAYTIDGSKASFLPFAYLGNWNCSRLKRTLFQTPVVSYQLSHSIKPFVKSLPEKDDQQQARTFCLKKVTCYIETNVTETRISCLGFCRVEFYNFNLLQHYNLHSKSGGKIDMKSLLHKCKMLAVYFDQTKVRSALGKISLQEMKKKTNFLVHLSPSLLKLSHKRHSHLKYYGAVTSPWLRMFKIYNPFRCSP